MTGRAVPNDPNMSPEVRRFLESLHRKANEVDPVVTDIDCTTLDATGAVTGNTFTEAGKRVLTVGGGRELEAGFTNTFINHGTKTSGTLTIDIGAGYFQRVVNGGNFTLQANDDVGCCVLHIVNGANSGTVTFGGTFTKKYPGPSLNDTFNRRFAVFIYGLGDLGTDYAVQTRD